MKKIEALKIGPIGRSVGHFGRIFMYGSHESSFRILCRVKTASLRPRARPVPVPVAMRQRGQNRSVARRLVFSTHLPSFFFARLFASSVANLRRRTRRGRERRVCVCVCACMITSRRRAGRSLVVGATAVRCLRTRGGARRRMRTEDDAGTRASMVLDVGRALG